jgi:hypothetical protein
MSNSVCYSPFSASRQPTLLSTRAHAGRPSSFWCRATDTPWSKTMRKQAAAATLVSDPGVSRSWRFYSPGDRDRQARAGSCHFFS